MSEVYEVVITLVDKDLAELLASQLNARSNTDIAKVRKVNPDAVPE